MARLLLGVSGGIAAYKALELARLAIKAGHAVRVIQTEASTRFVGTASFAGITGAPVLITRNDAARGLYNGDVGIALREKNGGLRVLFERQGGCMSFAAEALPAYELGFALTVHKSQGSEYPVVVLPLATQHYPMLARNLLYTGVTRGKQLVVVIGQPRAVAIAIRNVRAVQRLTNLAARLRQEPCGRKAAPVCGGTEGRMAGSGPDFTDLK